MEENNWYLMGSYCYFWQMGPVFLCDVVAATQLCTALHLDRAHVHSEPSCFSDHMLCKVLSTCIYINESFVL